jgi:hypothetical protein
MSNEGKVTNFKDLKILPLEDSEIQIIEWCPGENATNPPEQVHVLIRLPFENMGFAIRLKTRAGAARFLNTLRKHINNVWPPQ